MARGRKRKAKKLREHQEEDAPTFLQKQRILGLKKPSLEEATGILEGTICKIAVASMLHLTSVYQ